MQFLTVTNAIMGVRTMIIAWFVPPQQDHPLFAIVILVILTKDKLIVANAAINVLIVFHQHQIAQHALALIATMIHQPVTVNKGISTTA